MSRRTGPPLFELLRERGEQPPNSGPSPTPDSNPDADRPRPAPPPPQDSGVPWSGGGVTRAERSAATFQDTPQESGVRLTMTHIYMGIAILLLVAVGIWALAFNFGKGEGKAELDQLVGNEPIVTPNTNQGGSPVEPRGNQETPSSTPTTAAPDPVVFAPASGPWVLSTNASRVPDPREPGVNYLELATLPAAQAQDAIDYLAQNGVPAIGIPVDRSGRAGNNPSRYTLFSLGLAVPSGQFRSTTADRREHERLVASVGARWQRDKRGGSDFSQTLWRKHDP